MSERVTAAVTLVGDLRAAGHVLRGSRALFTCPSCSSCPSRLLLTAEAAHPLVAEVLPLHEPAKKKRNLLIASLDNTVPHCEHQVFAPVVSLFSGMTMKELELRHDGGGYAVFEGTVLLRRFSTAQRALQAFPAARYVLTDYFSGLHADLAYATYTVDAIERDLSNN